MRFSLRLAWRNLSRNRRRSVLTLLAVLLPVLILDLMWGFSNAVQRNLFESTTQLETGHLQVHRADYRQLQTGLPLIQNVTPVLQIIAQDPAIERFAVRLDLPALAAHGDRSRGVLLRGVRPGKAGQLSALDKWVRTGRPLKAGDRKVALAGSNLLKALHLKVGQSVILLSASLRTGTGVLIPKVVGSLAPPSPQLSRSIIELPLADARSLVHNPQAASSVVVLLKDISGPWDQSRIEREARSLQAKLGPDYLVETWAELAPATVGLFKIIQPLYLAFSLIFFLLGGLVVLNTLYLSVLERTRELGVVLALGSSRRRVLGWIEVEAVLLAGLGALLGSALGLALVGWGSLGFRLPGFYAEFVSIGLNNIFYLSISPAEAALSAGLMFVLALTAAAYPGWRAARLEPVEAMHFAG
ncbi:MAG TPA: ABC transporter permease [Candidatus Fraserbacteria bacterium]|nr:ABC transporter permease [Candidatus Fraserbacteria bacterium]